MFKYLEKAHVWASQQIWNPLYIWYCLIGLLGAVLVFLVLGLFANGWAYAIARVLVGLWVIFSTPLTTPNWGKTAIIRYGAACLFFLSVLWPGLDMIALLIVITSDDHFDDFPPLRRMPEKRQQSDDLSVPGVLRGV